MRLTRIGISLVSTVAVVGLSLSAPGLAQAAPPGPATPSVPADPLALRETAAGTQATFGHSRTFITASSAAQGSGKHKVTIDIGAKKFTASLDRATGSMRWGGGGRVLDPADLSALQALARALAADLSSSELNRLGEDRERLLRFTLLLAEAPAGVKLKDLVLPAPVFSEVPAGEEAAAGPPAPQGACAAEEAASGSPSGGDEIMAAAACQVPDDDGIRYMSCSRLNRTLYHDAGGHCFLSESVNSGPGSSGSLGECGSNNTVRIGTYTYDCGEHDRCGRVHGGGLWPWDSECGDEYWDADDDFLWAPNGRC